VWSYDAIQVSRQVPARKVLGLKWSLWISSLSWERTWVLGEFYLLHLHFLFVSILASFCVWTKSLMCKDAVNRDSIIQSDVRRFCLQVRRHSSSLSAVRTPLCPLFHPSGWCVIPSGQRAPSVRTLTLYREGSVPACTRLDVLAARPHASQFSNGFSDSFQVPRKGRSINRLDDVVSCPDACLRKARIVIQN
jgi:hypothetical protein